MIKCKDCKFWRRETLDWEDEKRFGRCSNPKFIESGFPKKTYPSDSFLYWGFAGYPADFATGQNFRCIHVEEA